MTRTSARASRGHSHASSPAPKLPRSMFDRSHGLHTAFDPTPDGSNLLGGVVPVYRDELLPGDSFRLKPTIFVRFTTMAVPVFSSIFVDVHFFAVPLRLIWENAEEFFGAEPGGPGTRVDRQTPKADFDPAPAANSLYDFLGYMPATNITTAANWPTNLYARAYNLIWTDWFRAPEISAPATLDLDDGPDDPADYYLRPRMKRRDYYTQGLATPQLGPDVTLPLGTSAPVVPTTAGKPSFDVGGVTDLKLRGTAASTNVDWSATAATNDAVWNTTGLETDLTSAVAPSVSELRLAFAEQHLYEAFSMYGAARYTELVHGVWGVRSPDARLQRPEFLGSTTTRLSVNPVATTANISGETGELGAFAVGVNTGGSISYSSTEHQVVLGVASVRTQYVYDQGFDRELLRDVRFDYATPQFYGVGEQPIESRELYADGTANDTDVFAYVPRYDEYRRKVSHATGVMRSWYSAGTLAYYHTAQLFSTRPTLNEAFMKEDPPMSRITITSTEPDIKFDAWYDLKSIRPIPLNGRPGLARL
jgi:hypothetical protein